MAKLAKGNFSTFLRPDHGVITAHGDVSQDRPRPREPQGGRARQGYCRGTRSLSAQRHQGHLDSRQTRLSDSPTLYASRPHPQGQTDRARGAEAASGVENLSRPGSRCSSRDRRRGRLLTGACGELVPHGLDGFSDHRLFIVGRDEHGHSRLARRPGSTISTWEEYRSHDLQEHEHAWDQQSPRCQAEKCADQRGQWPVMSWVVQTGLQVLPDLLNESHLSSSPGFANPDRFDLPSACPRDGR